MDILRMEVAFVQRIVIACDTLLQVFFHLQVSVDNQGTARLYQFGVMAETLEIGLLGAVDIQMVGIGRGDNSHPWTEPMEGAVELISLYHHIV